MTMNLPEGFYHALLGFTGTTLPTGAACTFQGALGAGMDTPGEVASAIQSAWDTKLKAQTCSGVTLATIRVKLGPMDDGPFTESAPGLNGTLTTTGTLTPAVSMLVRKNTNRGGKGGSGRMYYPVMNDGEVDNVGAINPAFLAPKQTAFSDFLGLLNTSLIPMAVAHTFGTYINSKGDEVTVAPEDPTPVTSLTVQARVATQRRRMRR